MNQDIAKILYELSVLYSFKSVPFKPRALERASESIASLGTDVRDIYAAEGVEGLERIPGVGPGIAERIVEYITTKRIKEYTALKKKTPMDIEGIMAIEGIGPKTLLLLYKKLGIKTRKQLEQKARAGKLAAIKGIGPKGQERILTSIGYLTQSKGRRSPGTIWPAIRTIADAIESWPHVKQLELVGSLRRMQETIGDLDMLAISDDTEDTLRRFAALPQVLSVYAHGDRNVQVRLGIGLDGDLWIMPKESYGAAMIAWTGSKQHNVHLRTIAKKKGYLLNEFGLFKGTKLLVGKTEEEVYKKLGMDWVPPELRTDGGEIEAAQHGTLPRLIGYGDIKGDLQIQTDWTDGRDSILTMAKAAHAAGLEYIAITDHTKSLTIAHGLDEKAIKKQWAEIDRVQKQVPGIRILKGSESDIKKDGTMDLSDAVLAELDVVGGSVHSYFDLPAREQTDRIVRAMESPHVDIIFHPTGRLIGRRSPYAVDMDALLAAAKRTGTVMEANAYPDRLDLADVYIRQAVTLGVLLSIDTDAHKVSDLAYMRWGVGQARRGWARKQDVINTRSVKDMLKILK